MFVLSTARTAIGTFGGALKDVPNTQLATTAVRAAIERSGLAPDAIGHVVMGNVIPTDTKDACLARVAAIDAGCSIETPAFNVNQMHMDITAENVAQRYCITRGMQDRRRCKASSAPRLPLPPATSKRKSCRFKSPRAKAWCGGLTPTSRCAQTPQWTRSPT